LRGLAHRRSLTAKGRIQYVGSSLIKSTLIGQRAETRRIHVD
jgi:hypothetical protein